MSEPIQNGVSLAMSSAMVELDVFSGKPNPQWSLAESALTSLMQEVARLDKAASQAVSPPQNLGYRGVRVVPSPTNASDWTLFVGGGYAFVTDRKGTIVRLDRDRRIERWILHTGQSVVDKRLLEDILAHLQ